KQLAIPLAARRINGFLPADACKVQAFMRTQTVKLQPGIFPGIVFVGAIGGDLAGYDQEAVSGRNGILLLVGQQYAFSGDDIVEQVVIARMRSIRVRRCGAFPSELVEVQVNEPLVTENMKFQLAYVIGAAGHDTPSFSRLYTKMRPDFNKIW